MSSSHSYNSQGKRISQALNDAFNQAIKRELQMGHAIKGTELVDGVANGVMCICASIRHNMGADEPFTRDVVASIPHLFAFEFQNYVEGGKAYERVTVNPHKGTA